MSGNLASPGKPCLLSLLSVVLNHLDSKMVYTFCAALATKLFLTIPQGSEPSSSLSDKAVTLGTEYDQASFQTETTSKLGDNKTNGHHYFSS